eukprot:1035269-Pyramimonas_sp.AAC.1
MAPPQPVLHTPHTPHRELRRKLQWEGATPKAPMGRFAWHHRSQFGHPSHGSWPHRDLHLMFQKESSHDTTVP